MLRSSLRSRAFARVRMINPKFSSKSRGPLSAPPPSAPSAPSAPSPPPIVPSKPAAPTSNPSFTAAGLALRGLVLAGTAYVGIAAAVEYTPSVETKVAPYPVVIAVLKPARDTLRQVTSRAAFPALRKPQAQAPVPEPVQVVAETAAPEIPELVVVAAETPTEPEAESEPEPEPHPTESPVIHESTEESVAVDEQLEIAVVPAAEPASMDTDHIQFQVLVEQDSEPVDPLEIAELPSERKAKQLRTHPNIFASMEAIATQSLRTDLEASILKDLATLDNETLKFRIAQMVGEFIERAKFEAIRIQQAVKSAQDDANKTYADLMAQQRSELQFELRKAVMAKEEQMKAEISEATKALTIKHEELVQKLVREKASEYEAKLSEEKKIITDELVHDFTERLQREIAQLQANTQQEMLQQLELLEKFKAEVAALSQALLAMSDRDRDAHALHRLSAASLSLERKLMTSQPIGEELTILKKAAASDPLLTTVLGSLPSALYTEGVPTIAELRARFTTVRTEVRKAAFAPDNVPGLVGQVVGNAIASVTLPITGLVEGPGVEETLARTHYYIEMGDLTSAVREAGTVKGFPGRLMSDWLTAAKHRLEVEQAIDVIRAHTALLHSRFV